MDARAIYLSLIGSVCLFAATPCRVQAQEKATLWSFLGIPQAYDHLHGALTNRRGKHPGLEKKPALKSLADPANLKSEVPVIKKAAEIKQAEDLKQQKVKAIRYLAQIGCGCYDTDGSVTEALLASSDDCTEEVRLATVESIAEAASGVCCAQCGQTCCCNKKILQRLAEMAYERDDSGCYKEPSARVRQAAAEALQICCPNTAPVVIEEPQPGPERPRETVEEGPEGTEGGTDTPPLPPTPDRNTLLMPGFEGQPGKIRVSDFAGASGAERFASDSNSMGVVVHANVAHRLAHVHFEQQDLELSVGTRLSVYGTGADGNRYEGELVVIQAFPGSANVRPTSETHMSRIMPGCQVMPARTRLVRR